MNQVLIVETSYSDSRVMSGLLMKAGYEPIAVNNMEAAKREVTYLASGAVIVSAVKFQDGTARELIDWLKGEGYRFPVLAVVDKLNPMELIELMGNWGAVNVIQRPAIGKQLIEQVGKYVASENILFVLHHNLIPRQSENFQKIEHSICKIASTNANTIIFGEIGMGKEQIARQIYAHSSRRQKPITVIEAGGAALIGSHDPSSDRSEMYNRIKGYFSKSDGGTIILKNVELLNFDKQSVLLHILETEHPNVRVICTADPHLLQMVTDKEFRANLFYILRECDIKILPLREVSEDIPILADYFLTWHAKNNKEHKKHLDASAIKILKLHHWPGNIRELRTVIDLAAFHTDGDTISDTDIEISQSFPRQESSILLNDPNVEKQRILVALAKTGGKKTQTAKLLGIARSTLDCKLKKYGLG